jgi:hypothetical protein
MKGWLGGSDNQSDPNELDLDQVIYCSVVLPKS